MPYPHNIGAVACLPSEDGKDFGNSLSDLQKAVMEFVEDPNLHFVRFVVENRDGSTQNVDIHYVQGRLQLQITKPK